jgi:hypothetical protein
MKYVYPEGQFPDTSINLTADDIYRLFGRFPSKTVEQLVSFVESNSEIKIDFGNWFRFSIDIAPSKSLYLHFEINKAIELSENNVVERLNIRDFERRVFCTQSDDIDYYNRAKPNADIHKPVIVVPIKTGNYDALLIDGNHRFQNRLMRGYEIINYRTLSAKQTLLTFFNDSEQVIYRCMTNC